jgi:hypothetical protein
MPMKHEVLGRVSSHVQVRRSEQELDIMGIDIFKLHSLILDHYKAYIQS